MSLSASHVLIAELESGAVYTFLRFCYAFLSNLQGQKGATEWAKLGGGFLKQDLQNLAG